MRALLGVLVVLLTACGGDTGDGAAAPSPAAADLVGTLGGDAQLEGGCVWVEADGTRYEVQFPEGYVVSADPVELRGPDGEVIATEGDRLALEGEAVTDVATICQIGPVFRATSVAPLP